jgi:heat shock protein HslJ
MKRLLPLAVLLLAGCATMSPPPPPIGDDVYRAVGTEPFWSLVIGERTLVFTEANAPGVEIVQPKPRPIIGFAGEIYQTPRINVNIVHARCSDGMSDRIYADKVQLRVDGRSFEGCGGATVMPATLAGTSWTVESVNGRPTGGGERFQVSFDGERMSGQFGCNRVSGGYRFDGLTFTAGALAMTRMACPDMSFEQLAAGILAAPLAARMDGDRLVLANPPSTIVLKRNI